MSTSSILVVGASGRLGLEIVRAAGRVAEKPAIHAFVRTPSKIPPQDKELCASVVQGDALSPSDIERGLEETKAKYVVLTVGVPNSVAKSNLREMSAKALIDVIRTGGKFEDVKVIVVSSVGAGGTKLDFGMGLGLCVSFFIRHVLKDHDKREQLFAERFAHDEAFKKRVLIIRPTTLTLGTPRGGITIFEGSRAPTPWISREDLAKWIIDEVCAGGPSFGKAINVTGL